MKKIHLILALTLLIPATVCLCFAAEAINLSATFIDRNNVTTEVTNVAFIPDYLNREVQDDNSLYGTRGHAEMTIPRTKISRVDFIDGMAEANAFVTLRDGRRVALMVDSANTQYYGTNSFGGIFMIRTQHIRSIIYK